MGVGGEATLSSRVQGSAKEAAKCNHLNGGGKKKFLCSTMFKIMSKITEYQEITVIFLKSIMSIKDSQCDYSPQKPQNLPMPLFCAQSEWANQVLHF